MKIKIKLLLLVLFGAMFSGEVVAQIVSAEGGYAVINNSGLPEGSVKSKQELENSKTVGSRVRRHMQTLSISPNAQQGGTHIYNPDHLQNGTNELYVNQKVSRKFAVAPADHLVAVYWATGASWFQDYFYFGNDANTEVDGSSAVGDEGCAAYAHMRDESDKGLWRLPTQRELMIIYAHKGQLVKVVSDFMALTSDYWSATESGYNAPSEDGVIYAWRMNFANGDVMAAAKTNSHKTRCIKDL